MNRWLLCALLGSGLALFPSAARGQEGRVPFLVAPTTSGVALRWAWSEGERPAGYHIERQVAGRGGWGRITERPIARARDRAGARELLGASYARYESLLFPPDPRAELRDPESHRSLLLLAADVEPALARLLGLRYDDRTARAGEAYAYRLIAVTRAGERVVATSAAVTAGSYVQPAAPESLEARPTRRGIALHWATRPLFTAYNIHRRAGRGAATRINEGPVTVFTNDGGVPTESSPVFYRDTAVGPGDTVRYTVEGIDPFGRPSRRSAEVSVVVRDVTAPAPPPTVSTAVRGDTVVVSWTAAPDSDVVAYRVWRGARREGAFAPVGGALATNTRGIRDAGRPARQLQWYRVTALDRAGNESPPSFLALAEVPDLEPPRAPDSLRGTADTGRLALAWRPVPARDLLGYRVYRASQQPPTGEFGLLTPQPLARAQYTDTVRKRADHPFFYRVTAVDSAYNESPASAVLALRPPDRIPPSPPQIIAVHPGEEMLVVTWAPNPEPDVVAYRVRHRSRGARDGGWVERPDSVPGAARADTIPGVTPRVLFEVSVVAIDDAGNRSAPAAAVVGQAYKRRPPAPLDVQRVAFEPARRAGVIHWRAGSDVARVVILRRAAGDSVARGIGTAAGRDGRFEDVTVRPAQRYEYGLRVLDAYGNSVEPKRFKSLSVPEERR